jgi:hypothetical protein
MKIQISKHWLPAILMLALCLSLQGKRMSYTVKAMGLSVASLSIERDPGASLVSVKTKSLITNALFPSIDNAYTIRYSSGYLPLKYNRAVRQNKLNDNVLTVYDHSKSLAAESHSRNGETISYKINPATRDFFSFIAMLSDGKASAGSYELDANGSLWKVSVSYLGSKVIKTAAGKFSARGYKLSFSSATHSKAPYVDMGTHNLFQTGSKVELWGDGKGLVVKANMKKGAIGSSWELKDITP